MKITALAPRSNVAKSKHSFIDSIAQRAVFNLLAQIKYGGITLVDGDQQWQFGSTSKDYSQQTKITVTDPGFYRLIMSRGSIGAGEAYILNYWQTNDLVAVVRLMCRNMEKVEKMESGWAAIGMTVQKIRHRLRANTIRGSRNNIQAHYDLSNELFACFLDSRMMYSSAIYCELNDDLETAARNKLQIIGEKLQLKPENHVLEIGTGWGGLAIYMAQNFGCRVTTTTISAEQHQYAIQRVKELGLENKITLLLQDYRELQGKYDRVVSVEMIEAVGQQYLPTYFKKCCSLLDRGGKMLIQAITLPEQRYEYATKHVDFIQRYIFPGGSLPSVEVMLKATGQHTQLQLDGLDDIGLDYAQTLNHWRQRFNHDLGMVRKLGFDETFVRLWHFYLAYCEGGFRERAISTVQAVFRKV